MKIILIAFCFIISGCSFTPLKCSFWMPIIAFEAFQAKNYDEAIKESAGGTKCVINF